MTYYIFIIFRTLNNSNLNLVTFNCEERQKKKLIDIIRTALNEVACDELLSSGCDELNEIETVNAEHREPKVS